jgi:choline dehydrogenase-like flavoprotein
MGDDPGTSVLDPFNRVWDADNVLVTDAAAFPSGCWQNLTLTIMALTARACEHITQEYRAGRV